MRVAALCVLMRPLSLKVSLRPQHGLSVAGGGHAAWRGSSAPGRRGQGLPQAQARCILLFIASHLLLFLKPWFMRDLAT